MSYLSFRSFLGRRGTKSHNRQSLPESDFRGENEVQLQAMEHTCQANYRGKNRQRFTIKKPGRSLPG